ncbi:MAG TPA: DNA cytosine methyltransferase [Candidatus Deferrimicrobium sp.]|nr:DNA cytosine methyltransferase [Candidatus Kapabacteria bacterium]HLP58132.1 DNA cytosine methyltransferase [Candidatus Deferrimicrobium sp.]
MEEKIKYSAVDLFCGIGGLTHGLIKAGIPVNVGIDIDETCRFAYEINNQTQFMNMDVRDISGEEILRLFPEGDIKILVGCAPCQPFSKHTQKIKNRQRDEKWRLLYSFMDLVDSIHPEIVSMENVTQIVYQEIFKDFVKRLRLLDYYVFWKPVFCPDYGIPQTRTRLVLLASRLGEIELIPETHSPKRYRTVRRTIGNLESIRDGESSKKDPLHHSAKLSSLNKERIRRSTAGGTWKDWDMKLVSPCHIRSTGKTYCSVYARMEWDKPAPTITTQFYSFGTGRFGHPEQDRALSIREGALLQTFPKLYKFFDKSTPLSIKTLGIHIGNAVPVRLGTIIGRSIIRHLETK